MALCKDHKGQPNHCIKIHAVFHKEELETQMNNNLTL